jgi:hypothetical protein
MAPQAVERFAEWDSAIPASAKASAGKQQVENLRCKGAVCMRRSSWVNASG